MTTRRWTAILLGVFLPPLLAGCTTDLPAAPPDRVSAAELKLYDDDSDCDGRPDKVAFAAARAAGVARPVPFQGIVEAALRRRVADQPVGGDLETWRFRSGEPGASYEDQVVWVVDGRNLTAGGAYRVEVRLVLDDGGRFEAFGDFDYLALAAEGGPCRRQP